jgi:hypothetical protein
MAMYTAKNARGSDLIDLSCAVHGNVNEIFSTIAPRDGHHYEVRLNHRTNNPRILELFREIDRPPSKAS